MSGMTFDGEASYEDQEARADYYREIRRVNRGGGHYDCPTCGGKGALSAWEKRQGYHCKSCTRAAEGPVMNHSEECGWY